MEKIINLMMLICKLVCCAIGMAMVTTGFISFFFNLNENIIISLISTLSILYFIIGTFLFLFKWKKIKYS
jgi:hypothetical protein